MAETVQSSLVSAKWWETTKLQDLGKLGRKEACLQNGCEDVRHHLMRVKLVHRRLSEQNITKLQTSSGEGKIINEIESGMSTQEGMTRTNDIILAHP